MSILTNIRDKAVEALIRRNETIKRFGEIQNISIDSGKGFADISVLLHGEPAPLDFRAYYTFNEMGKDTQVVVSSISCGRLWIDEVIGYWLESHELSYTLPGIAGGIARILF